jgi:FlaA1/EpsC-like NDP-sugar epimerase
VVAEPAEVGRETPFSFGKVAECLSSLAPSLQAWDGDARDALIVMESIAVALIDRVSGDAVAPSWPSFLPFAVFSALGFVLLLNANGVYQSVPRYRGLYQDVRLLSATAITAGSLFLVVFCVGPFGFGMTRVNIVPLSVPLVGSVLAYAQLVAVRHIRRVVALSSRRSEHTKAHHDPTYPCQYPSPRYRKGGCQDAHHG